MNKPDPDETLCPPEECVVRTDIIMDDVISPPDYCECCPLPECTWQKGQVCRGLRYGKARNDEMARGWNRERMRLERANA